MWFEVGEYKQFITSNKSNCTCPDFVYRRLKKKDFNNPLSKIIQTGECKHIREVRIKLGQENIYKLLKKNDWMSIKEITKKLDVGSSSISLCLNKLINQGEVIKKETRYNGIRYCLYKIK